MNHIAQIYIGYDQIEHIAYEVAVQSLLRRATCPVNIAPLDWARLQQTGLIWRPVDRRGGIYDIVSNAPCATDFSNARFLTPILCQSGWALFVDCDVVFLDDVAALFALADSTKAVMVVPHAHNPASTEKMGGAYQSRYPRKNWSSVALFNCDHQANARLSLHDVNTRPGRDLHRFYWLADSEIGFLPARWNWLVNEQDKPLQPGIAHFTNGGPFTPGWQGAPHDNLWINERDKA